MRLRWLFGNFTDPQYDLTRADQKRLSQIAHEHYTPPASFIRWTWTVVLIPPFVAFSLLPLALRALGLEGQNWPFMAGIAAIILAFWPYSAWAYGALYIRPIRRAMRLEGYDLCVHCGYDLRAHQETEAACPECGREREPFSSPPDAGDGARGA